MSTDPRIPTAVETAFYEPDEGEVIAVLPCALWLTAGDIVELDEPPRLARVLSSRLQLRRDEPARVLIVLDVPDSSQGDAATEMMLGAAVEQSLPPTADLDDELEKLTEEVNTEPAPNEA